MNNMANITRAILLFCACCAAVLVAASGTVAADSPHQLRWEGPLSWARSWSLSCLPWEQIPDESWNSYVLDGWAHYDYTTDANGNFISRHYVGQVDVSYTLSGVTVPTVHVKINARDVPYGNVTFPLSVEANGTSYQLTGSIYYWVGGSPHLHVEAAVDCQ
jgi:hypothetical protein